MARNAGHRPRVRVEETPEGVRVFNKAREPVRELWAGVGDFEVGGEGIPPQRPMTGAAAIGVQPTNSGAQDSVHYPAHRGRRDAAYE